MQKKIALQRLLCGFLDTMVILIPIQFIMIGIFQTSQEQADLLFKLLFSVYSVLFIEYANGQTLGKLIGRLKVIDHDTEYGKRGMLYVGVRELTKSLYFVPVFGWILGLCSVFLMFKTGRSIHDYTGGTRVITELQEKLMKEEEAEDDKIWLYQ